MLARQKRFAALIKSQDYTVHEEILVKSNQEIPRAGESSAILLKDGSIMLAYSQFSEKWDSSPAAIVSRISKDGGITWSAPEKMIEKSPDALNVMSVSFLRLHSGRIAFLYMHKFSKDDCIPYICFSDDDGKNWSTPLAVTERGKFHCVNNDRLFQCSSGRLLIPSHIKIDDNKRICGVFYSDDCGLSWRQSKFFSIKNKNVIRPHKIKKEQENTWKNILKQGVCSQEPGVIELIDGKIMMWVRTDGDYMYRSVSEDKGENWSDFKPVPSIISPLSPQTIKRIPGTSRLLCIYNDRSRSSFAEDENWLICRTPLSIAVSDDEGKKWRTLGNIEDTSHNYCYISSLFFEDKVLLSYYVSDNYIEDNKEKRRNLASLKIKIIKTAAFLNDIPCSYQGKKIMKVGIIGAAGGNAKNHINAWRNAGACIKTVIDINEAKGKDVAASLGATYLSDYRDIQTGDLDAVSISLPPYLHADICKFFLEKNIHVLCEKPVTLNHAEGEHLEKILKGSKAFLMAGFCLRFNPLYIKMRELIQSGEIGKPVMINSRFSTLNNAAAGWRSDPSKGGGMCLVNRIHSIDLAYWLLNQKIISVDAYGSSMFFGGKAEDNCLLIMEHEKGCISKIYGHYWRIKKSIVDFEIIGTKGRIAIENNNALTLEQENKDPISFNLEVKNMYEEEVRHFISSIQNNKSPSCGLEDSMRATDIVEKAILSMKERKRICLVV